MGCDRYTVFLRLILPNSHSMKYRIYTQDVTLPTPGMSPRRLPPQAKTPTMCIQIFGNHTQNNSFYFDL